MKLSDRSIKSSQFRWGFYFLGETQGGGAFHISSKQCVVPFRQWGSFPLVTTCKKRGETKGAFLHFLPMDLEGTLHFCQKRRGGLTKRRRIRRRKARRLLDRFGGRGGQHQEIENRIGLKEKGIGLFFSSFLRSSLLCIGRRCLYPILLHF